MHLILIIGAFQALFMAVLIYSKRNKTAPDYFLATLFLVITLTQFNGYMEVYNRLNDYPYPGFINTSTPLIFLHGPLMWFYVRSLTKQSFRFRPVYLLHFLPFALVLGRFAATIYFLPADEKIMHESEELFKDDLFFPLVMIGIILFTQGYYILIWRMLKRYDKGIRNYFSKLEDIDLRWLRFLVMGAIMFYASISVLYFIDYFIDLMSYVHLQITGFSFATVYVLVLGFYGYRQGNLFVSQRLEIDLEKASDIPYQEGEIETADERFLRSLLSHMKENEPYLDPELTLGKLSDELRVGPDYLSGILNGRLGKNFFDFVNHYRIEAFKQQVKLAENRKLKLISIAYDCGFNSKPTFNRVFKRATGMTPSEYLVRVST